MQARGPLTREENLELTKLHNQKRAIVSPQATAMNELVFFNFNMYSKWKFFISACQNFVLVLYFFDGTICDSYFFETIKYSAFYWLIMNIESCFEPLVLLLMPVTSIGA